jgi:hypothetical protein
MKNFLLTMRWEQNKHNKSSGEYIAIFFDGQNIPLNSTRYQDAVLEADNLEPPDILLS